MRIDWDNVRVRLHCAGRAALPRGVALAEGWNAEEVRTDHTVALYTAGRGAVVTRDRHAELRAGDCLWMRRGRLYDLRQEPDDPQTLTFIHFDLLDRAGRPLPVDTPLPPEITRPSLPAHAEALARRVTDLVSGTGMGYAWAPQEGPVRQIATTLLTALLMEIDHDSATAAVAPALAGGVAVGEAAAGSDAQGRRNAEIAQLANELLEAGGEVPTVAELARRAGYSQSHFSRLFFGAFGRPPRQYLIEVRIGRALNLLLHSSMPIGQIAETLGYKNIFNFSRQFKQKTGRTPTACRRARTLWDLAQPESAAAPRAKRIGRRV